MVLDLIKPTTNIGTGFWCGGEEKASDLRTVKPDQILGQERGGEWSELNLCGRYFGHT